MSIKFEDLSDTITPEDSAKWRDIGFDHARNRFHAKGFPILNVVDNRLIADKRDVLIFELKIEPKDFVSFLNKSGKYKELININILPIISVLFLCGEIV